MAEKVARPKDMEDEVYPEEEQGIGKKETSEEKELEMEEGELEEEPYSAEGREKLLEDDEISPAEEAFMEGAEGRGNAGNCAHCHSPLGEDRENIIEREIKGKKCMFCSEKCASAGPAVE